MDYFAAKMMVGQIEGQFAGILGIVVSDRLPENQSPEQTS